MTLRRYYTVYDRIAGRFLKWTEDLADPRLACCELGEAEIRARFETSEAAVAAAEIYGGDWAILSGLVRTLGPRA